MNIFYPIICLMHLAYLICIRSILIGEALPTNSKKARDGYKKGGTRVKKSFLQ